jgi:deoxyhypusine synthase
MSQATIGELTDLLLKFVRERDWMQFHNAKDMAISLVLEASEVLELTQWKNGPEMHKYAIQITVADVRDGALSGSTLKEASSWGKVDTVFEQMVYSEATIAMPLIAGYAYHKGAWRTRAARKWAQLLETTPVA